MNDPDAAGSPLERTEGAAGPRSTEAFELLGDGTRLAVLLALWEAYDPLSGENAVGFSDLRRRVGYDDPGNFDYHLDRLVEGFVRRTDDGYELAPVGLKLVQTVIAGTAERATFEPAELDAPCHRCGASTALCYENGWLYHRCTDCARGLPEHPESAPEGVLFGQPFPPAALENRTPEELFAASVFRLVQVVTMKDGGLCPRCSGVVESSLDICDAHDPGPDGPCPACGRAAALRVRWVCTVCKYAGGGPPGATVLSHPDVVAFYRDHGVDVVAPNDFESARRVLTLLREHESDLRSTDPVRIRVTIRCGGDELALTLDGELEVLEVTGRDG
jgi:hypothetical protein